MASAATISVRDTLGLLDDPFAELATGVARGQFVFWLGSGISCDRVDDLQRVIKRVLVFLQARVDPGDPDCPFAKALGETFDLAQLSAAERLAIDTSLAVDLWPNLDGLLAHLTNQYAQLLDISIAGQPEDYLLWDAVDVPTTFGAAGQEPDVDHLCLAVLALEGAATDIATANWDGLIEAAVSQIAEDPEQVLGICVRAEDLREPRRRSRLLKFHGCAVKAAKDPGVYRPLLIARHSQITQWPFNRAFIPLRDQLVDLAVTRPTLMIGLSAQDTNIQHVIADAQARMRWPWPSHPPAYVFAGNSLGVNHRNILRLVYQDGYPPNRQAVEDSALIKAFSKPLLSALVLHVIAAKLSHLQLLADAPHIPAGDRSILRYGVLHLRDKAAETADTDRMGFIRSTIQVLSLALSLFRDGRGLAPGSSVYRPLGGLPIHQIAADPSTKTSGLPELAVVVGLLGGGVARYGWQLAPPATNDGKSGAVTIGPAGSRVRIYFVANSEAALKLEIGGIIAEDAADVVAFHSTAPVPRQPRSPRLPPGRTGRPAPRHVDVRGLLESADGIHDLERRFREEAML